MHTSKSLFLHFGQYAYFLGRQDAYAGNDANPFFDAADRRAWEDGYLDEIESFA